jgi:hypothetical protein
MLFNFANYACAFLTLQAAISVALSFTVPKIPLRGIITGFQDRTSAF